MVAASLGLQGSAVRRPSAPALPKMVAASLGSAIRGLSVLALLSRAIASSARTCTRRQSGLEVATGRPDLDVGSGCGAGGLRWAVREGPGAGPLLLSGEAADRAAVMAALEQSGRESLRLTVSDQQMRLDEYLARGPEPSDDLLKGSQLFTDMAGAHDLLVALRNVGPRAGLSLGLDMDLLGTVDQRPIASIGWPSTGSKLHGHECAWLYLGSGRKQWLLFPPGFDVLPWEEADPCGLVQDHLTGAKPQLSQAGGVSCVQSAGEVILVPQDWSHVTCNSGPGLTVGWGSQGHVTDWSALQFAARAGDVRGPFWMKHSQAGEHPLMISARHGHVAFFRAYVDDFGAGPLANLEVAADAVVQAAARGHALMVDHLISSFGDEIILGPCAANDTPLHIAARSCHARTCEVILQRGFEAGRPRNFRCVGSMRNAPRTSVLDAKDPKGATALARAARGGCSEIVELLLAWRADASAADSFGLLPLHHASFYGPKQVIERLISTTGPAAVKSADRNGQTSLHIAARYGHAAVVAALLNSAPRHSSALGSSRDATSLAPGDIAASSGHEPVIDALISANALTHEALHWASYNGHLGVVLRILQSESGSPSLKGRLLQRDRRMSATALHFAVGGGHASIVTQLLEMASSKLTKESLDREILQATDSSGRTPLDVARLRGFKALEDVLALAFKQQRRGRMESEL